MDTETPTKPEGAGWGIPAWARIFYGIGGVAIPLLCFAMGHQRPLDKPDWQSGRFIDYLKFLLGGPCTHVFYPLLAWSIFSLAATAIRPRLALGSWIMRWGIYSGAILSLHFSVLMYLIVNEIGLGGETLEKTIIAAYAILPLTALAGGYVARRSVAGDGLGGGLANRVEGVGIALVAGPPAALVYIFTLKEGPGGWPFGIFLLALITGPYWALAAYGFLSIRLLHADSCRPSSKAARFGLPAAWFGGYGAAFWISVRRAIEEYSLLPKVPNDCYVSAAAARGHKALVGARPVTLGGRKIWVNRQMCLFKGAEIALKVFNPRFHRLLRGIYDEAGAFLASMMVIPLLADAGYLALKPAEWVCRTALGGLFGGLRVIDRLLEDRIMGSVPPRPT